jgi:hypothetical protein
VSETMCRDIFPADVIEVGGAVYSNVRVFITDQRMIVWRLKKGVREIALDVALSEPIAADRSVLDYTLEVTTLTRGFLVNQRKGCGCHSPLKALGAPAEWESNINEKSDATVSGSDL